MWVRKVTGGQRKWDPGGCLRVYKSLSQIASEIPEGIRAWLKVDAFPKGNPNGSRVKMQDAVVLSHASATDSEANTVLNSFVLITRFSLVMGPLVPPATTIHLELDPQVKKVSSTPLPLEGKNRFIASFEERKSEGPQRLRQPTF